MEQNKSKQVLDKWALIVVIVIATAFGTTIIAKNWQYGLVFYLILTFAVVAVKKAGSRIRSFMTDFLSKLM